MVPELTLILLQGAAAKGPMPVEVWYPACPTGGLAIVAHGRNGAPGQPQMRPAISACLDRGMVTIAPHLCNSAANDAAGAATSFTMAGHLADLATVLNWAEQSRDTLGWLHGGQLLLCGHSMGAYAACRLAADATPGSVTGILALSPVVSGNALIEARRSIGATALTELAAELPQALAEWPGHDLLPLAAKLTMPMAIVTGADDTVTPPDDARLLGDAVPNLVAFDILPGEHHCPTSGAYAQALAKALDAIAARP